VLPLPLLPLLLLMAAAAVRPKLVVKLLADGGLGGVLICIPPCLAAVIVAIPSPILGTRVSRGLLSRAVTPLPGQPPHFPTTTPCAAAAAAAAAGDAGTVPLLLLPPLLLPPFLSFGSTGSTRV
jgi:hypothetical protein